MLEQIEIPKNLNIGKEIEEAILGFRERYADIAPLGIILGPIQTLQFQNFMECAQRITETVRFMGIEVFAGEAPGINFVLPPSCVTAAAHRQLQLVSEEKKD